MTDFNLENIEQYNLILSRRNHQHLGQLKNVTDLISKINLNAANEISFTIYKYGDDGESDIEPLWDEISDFKYIYVKELNEYYEITVDLSDGESVCKNITGMSACECELSQSYIYGLEINTENDIAREEYKHPTLFYKPNCPEESLLHRALYKMPQYSIKYVDSSLVKIQRTFSCDGQDVYSFLTETIAKEIQCLFVFDTVDKSISVYDLETVCVDCKHRGEFSDVCPKCGSHNLKYYGEDTTIYVDTENLAEEVVFTTDTDSVKNCFKLEAGDDNMTAAVTNLNPNGSSYIYYFSEEQKHDMSKPLIKRIEEYDKLNASYEKEYETIMSNVYENIDKIIYYTSEMMPKKEHNPTDAKKEAAKLTESNMSPLGLTSVRSSTSLSTVNTALKNYAKIYVHSGKYKIEINDGEFSYVGTDEEDFNYGYWYGNFKLTGYSDEEDTAISSYIRVKVMDDYESFLDQKIKKKLATNRDENGDIFDVLGIKDLEPFKKAIKLYCLNRLTSFHDAIQGVIDIMIEEGQGKEGASFYNKLYLPYKNKLDACVVEMNIRSKTIDEHKSQLEKNQKRQMEIQKILDFEKFLGDELHKEFCSHRREDKYSNENYISDGFDNDEVFKRAKEFLETAKKELVKSGEHQHSISSNIINLLAMEEFAPLKDKFRLGNFIRVGVDTNVYRLRLISCQITFDDTNNIDVEFSDVTKIKDGVSDLSSILDQANSMAGTYDSIAHQVEQSKKHPPEYVKNWIDKGLDLTNIKIISGADNQTFVQDKHGILIRTYDDISETYGDEQMRIINSTLAITDDNWKTIKTAIGKYYCVDPITGEEKVTYGIIGDTIVGRIILGNNLGIYSEDTYSSMIFDNRGLILNVNKGADNQYDRIIDIKVDGKSKFYISRDGDLIIDNNQIGDINQNIGEIVERTSKLESGLEGFKSEVSEKYTTKQEAANTRDEITRETQSAIQQKADSILLSVSTIYTTKTETTELASSIKATTEEIKLEVKKKVDNSEIGTKIEQNAESVRIAWNGNSKYLQFENGKLAIYDGSLIYNKKRAEFDESGNHFYRDGYYVGKIGTNQFERDNSKKGLVFDLEYDAAYMTWANMDSKNDSSYMMKWTYVSKGFGGYVKDRLYAGCDIDMGNNRLLNYRLQDSQINGHMPFVQILEMNSDGTVKRWSTGCSMTFKGGVLTNGTWSDR